MLGLDPESARTIYFLDLPLMLVLISLVYSATRYDQWPAILWEAVRWGVRLLVFLCGIGLALYLVNRF